MAPVDDSRPAFPFSALEPNGGQIAGTMYADNKGMSLRHYFAAKALQGILANDGALTRLVKSESASYEPFHAVAKFCYEQADAMLLEWGGK